MRAINNHTGSTSRQSRKGHLFSQIKAQCSFLAGGLSLVPGTYQQDPRRGKFPVNRVPSHREIEGAFARRKVDMEIGIARRLSFFSRKKTGTRPLAKPREMIFSFQTSLLFVQKYFAKLATLVSIVIGGGLQMFMNLLKRKGGLLAPIFRISKFAEKSYVRDYCFTQGTTTIYTLLPK